MPNEVSGKKIAVGLSWKFAERVIAQGVSTIVSVILARILAPEDYGVITMVLVFINIADVFVSSGFGQALIQDKDAGDIEFSTMTYVSIGVSIILYLLLFITAPLIADFYKQNDLCAVLRVLALRLPLAGFNSIQQTYIQKRMEFKKLFYATIGSTLASGVLGCWMAYSGYGSWALVTQYLMNSLISTLILYYIIDWKPHFIFSVEKAKDLFSFSWKLTVGDLVGTIYNEARSLVIGRMYSSAELAHFNKGEQFPKLIINNINTSIITVLYPAMAKVNDTIYELKRMTRLSIRTSSFILFPVLVGFSMVAEPFVKIVLTDKWLPCVPYLQIACFSYITVPLSSANLQSIKALGRSDVVMKLEIFKKIIGFLLVLLSMKFGVMVIALSGLLYSVIAVVANASQNRKLLGYTYKEQLMDIFPFAAMSGVMALAVYLASQLRFNTLSTLILQIIVGMIAYIGVALMTKNEIMLRLLNVLEQRRREK